MELVKTNTRRRNTTYSLMQTYLKLCINKQQQKMSYDPAEKFIRKVFETVLLLYFRGNSIRMTEKRVRADNYCFS